jgi:hypothetical protein
VLVIALTIMRERFHAPDVRLKTDLREDVRLEPDLREDVRLKPDLREDVRLKTDLREDVRLKPDLREDVRLKPDLRRRDSNAVPFERLEKRAKIRLILAPDAD